MIELNWSDPSSLSPDEAIARLRQLAAGKGGWTVIDASAIDLAQSLAKSRGRGGEVPFVDWYLVRHRDPRTQILIYLHHVIADGWSIPVLWRELASVYEAYEGGR